jgi:hypothetical protein
MAAFPECPYAPGFIAVGQVSKDGILRGSFHKCLFDQLAYAMNSHVTPSLHSVKNRTCDT